MASQYFLYEAGQPIIIGATKTMNFMKAYAEQTYALMRIVTGFLFLWHGSQKLLGYPPASSELPAR